MSVVARRPVYVLLSAILTVPAVPVAAQRPDPRPAGLTACQHDDFDGPALDRSRWTTVVRETSDLRVEKGQLVLPTTRTDLIWPNDPTLTQNIVLQPLPEAPFTATAKLALAPRQPWQQGGLVIYGDDDNYAKMVFQARGRTMDARHFQFVREDNGKPTGEPTPSLGAAYPDSVWVRFTSDGRFLRAAYSSDGVQFTAMPHSEALDGIVNPKIGLVSMAGSGVDAPVIDAKFDWFEICLVPVPGR